MGELHVDDHAFASMNGVNDTPTMRQVPAWTPRRKLKVISVGGGFSTLIFAHKLQHQHPEFQEIVEHKIYELRDEIGGTWLVNRYPGVQCDVPAHIYVCASMHVMNMYRMRLTWQGFSF